MEKFFKVDPFYQFKCLTLWKPILVKFWKSDVAKVISLSRFYHMNICTYTLVGFYFYYFHVFIIKLYSEKNKISRTKFTGTKTCTEIRYEEVRTIG